MKKMRAGVHRDLTRLRIPSIEWNEMECNEMYILVFYKKNNNTGTSLLRELPSLFYAN